MAKLQEYQAALAVLKAQIDVTEDTDEKQKLEVSYKETLTKMLN